MRNVYEEQYTQDIIAMWARVHGLATMLLNKTFIYKGNYIKLMENISDTEFKILS
jgi:hypothetical protein